jgi:2-polyprenyl-3-methyl-5-hydroxy-6-metoxy-1,4-benzoquinol methylase
MMQSFPNSPVTGGADVRLLTEIKASEICGSYKRLLNINVERFFTGIEHVQLYECVQSGYMFFHPFTISGDGKFYEALQEIPWYYMPWKWEHGFAINYVKEGDKILEIGCGRGGFLKGVRERFSYLDISALELNHAAVEELRKEGLNVHPQSIEEHASANTEAYDVVAAFQVLEHIDQVGQFLTAMIKVIKVGGKLIIGVPNTESFPVHDWRNDVLNLPPHHMGWWSKKSLLNLGELYKLRQLKIARENLQDYHREWYLNIFEVRLRKISPAVLKIYRRIKGRLALGILIRFLPSLFAGHTIVVVFEKVKALE